MMTHLVQSVVLVQLAKSRTFVCGQLWGQAEAVGTAASDRLERYGLLALRSCEDIGIAPIASMTPVAITVKAMTNPTNFFMT
jgi:hypothetical protein